MLSLDPSQLSRIAWTHRNAQFRRCFFFVSFSYLCRRQQEVKAQASGSARLTASERGRLGLPGRKDWKQQPNPGIAKRNARDIALTQVWGTMAPALHSFKLMRTNNMHDSRRNLRSLH
jgi:hypothetical protein